MDIVLNMKIILDFHWSILKRNKLCMYNESFNLSTKKKKVIYYKIILNKILLIINSFLAKKINY